MAYGQNNEILSSPHGECDESVAKIYGRLAARVKSRIFRGFRAIALNSHLSGWSDRIRPKPKWQRQLYWSSGLHLQSILFRTEILIRYGMISKKLYPAGRTCIYRLLSSAAKNIIRVIMTKHRFQIWCNLSTRISNFQWDECSDSNKFYVTEHRIEIDYLHKLL